MEWSASDDSVTPKYAAASSTSIPSGTDASNSCGSAIISPLSNSVLTQFAFMPNVFLKLNHD